MTHSCSKIIVTTFFQKALFLLTLLIIFPTPVISGVPLPLPILAASFTPDTIGPGNVSTMTFTLTNPDTNPVSALAFTNVLPIVPGDVDIASPANASTTCLDGIVTATDGGGTISFNSGKLAALQSCTVTVDVTSSAVGVLTNLAATLSSSAGGTSVSPPVDLTVVTTLPGFSKSFAPNSVPLGSRSTLTFTIDNTANASRIGNLDFTDILPNGMVVANPANASTDCISATVPNTTLIATPGTSIIILDANGSTIFPGLEVLPTGATCTVNVDVVATGIGTLNNVTELLADFTSSGKASDSLEVTVTPIALSKSFLNDPVPAGGTVELEFIIKNFDRNETATNIAFTDNLTTTLNGLITTGTLPTNPCGAGSSLTGGSTISFSGGTLASQASCTFTVSLLVPGAAATGSYVNTTSTISANMFGDSVSGDPAKDSLFIAPAPILTKTFINNPAAAGSTVDLKFAIKNTSNAFTATNISFTDEFFVGIKTAATIPTPVCGGGTASFTPLFNPPPPGSTIPAKFTLTGAQLAANTTCEFTITLNIETGTAQGSYLNTTSEISATVNGQTFLGKAATDTLNIVAAPTLSKQFTDDPVNPGSMATLQFTINHDANAPGDATNISFSDDLNAALAGLVATGLPVNDVCGTGSQISGTSTISLTGGQLTPGTSCTFSVTVTTPANAPAGAHTNTTSAITAVVSGLTATENAATDDLQISGLTISKSFTNDPVIPGGTVTLEFTLTNSSPVSNATLITFKDDFSSVLTGLTINTTGWTNTDICGTGSALTSTNADRLLTMTGGNLLAGQTCTFSVTLNVPAGAASNSYNNSTSFQSATMGATPNVPFSPAADTLVVSKEQLQLTKAFAKPQVIPGGTVGLTFTLTNLNTNNSATAIAFTDDLNAALPGLMTTGAIPANPCNGTGTLTGGTTISFSAGVLAAGASCTFTVTVQVPASVGVGSTITNTTSVVTGTMNTLAVTGTAASDDLGFVLLSLSKSFLSSGTPNTSVNLRFTINNLSGSTSYSSISFSDNLNNVITGLSATGLPRNDVCGTGSVLSGTSLITLTGASLTPGNSCSFDVPVLIPASATVGSYTNTTSELFLPNGFVAGVPASASLTVNALTSVTGPTATGTGNATVEIIGAGANCGFTSHGWVQPTPSLATHSFPYGVFQFSAGPDCSGSTSIRYTLPSTLASDTEFWKYGPTIANNTPHWYELPITPTGSQMTITITDGGLGDSDLLVNATITDPGGPALRVAGTAIPVSSIPMLFILISLLSIIGSVFIRQGVFSKR
jgi:Domain of unknown function DUF11